MELDHIYHAPLVLNLHLDQHWKRNESLKLIMDRTQIYRKLTLLDAEVTPLPPKGSLYSHTTKRCGVASKKNDLIIISFHSKFSVFTITRKQILSSRKASSRYKIKNAGFIDWPIKGTKYQSNKSLKICLRVLEIKTIPFTYEAKNFKNKILLYLEYFFSPH